MAERVARARAVLESHDINPNPVDGEGGELHRRRLLGHLQSFGWTWKYTPSGAGYRVEAVKRIGTSSSQTYVAHEDTLIDAITVALSMALGFKGLPDPYTA